MLTVRKLSEQVHRALRVRAAQLMSTFASMDNMVGKDFENGLAQLKAVAVAEQS